MVSVLFRLVKVVFILLFRSVIVKVVRKLYFNFEFFCCKKEMEGFEIIDMKVVFCVNFCFI